MLVASILNSKEIISLLVCAETNILTWKNKFKTFEEYQKWLISAVYNIENFIVSALYTDEREVVGYIVIETVVVYNHKELYVHDAFIREDYRFNNTSQKLFMPLAKAFANPEIEKAKWWSSLMPEEYWKEKSLGFNVKVLKYYCVEKDKESIDLLKKYKLIVD